MPSRYPNPIPLQYGQTYHVYNRGVNREPIFRERDNYRYFLSLYADHVGDIVDTYAYCLLGNHFHFLLRVRERSDPPDLTLPDLTGLEDLSGLKGLQTAISPSQHFSNLFNAYARSFNNRYGRTGALFQRPFGRLPVTTDGYFAHLMVYIHQNPQKHGFVDDYRDWPYTSYNALCGTMPTRLARADALDYLGGRAGFDMAHRADLTREEHASGL
jgi:REP element-mobilizing transposase RayT